MNPHTHEPSVTAGHPAAGGLTREGRGDASPAAVTAQWLCWHWMIGDAGANLFDVRHTSYD
jgi:hypothetical protein